ncbi:MAG TPA: hypothetical protein VGG44_10485 [Tepidisphaeraceae bacterium]|jgi:hypothetical protein
MKLRLFDNSLRLRLTPAEVAQLADRGLVTGETSFSATSSLSYRLRTSSTATSILASFDSSTVTVDIPAALAGQWTRTAEVGISATQETGQETGRETGQAARLKILIEKDFDCIDSSKNEPGVNFYPNPRHPKTSP